MTYVPTYLHHITTQHMTSNIHASFRFGQLQANSCIPPRADPPPHADGCGGADDPAPPDDAVGADDPATSPPKPGGTPMKLSRPGDAAGADDPVPPGCCMTSSVPSTMKLPQVLK